MSRPRGPNYYLALDLTPGVTHNQILHAYNRSKQTYESNSIASYGLIEGDSAKSIIEEIEEAFAVLGNPTKRREYDQKMGYSTDGGRSENTIC
jgi:DnaJ-class molecular chaperone